MTTLVCAEYGDDLEAVLKSEASGDFEKALLALFRNTRDTSPDVDLQLAERDATVSPVHTLVQF